MQVIYQPTSVLQGELLRTILRDYGIRSNLENVGGRMYADGLWIPLLLSVADEEVEDATEVITDALLKRESAAPALPMDQMACACGKTLEVPKGQEFPELCPWCDRELTPPGWAGRSP